MTEAILTPRRIAMLSGALRPRGTPVPGLLSLMAAALMIASAPALAKTASEGFADLAARLSPTVVNVSTTQTAARERGAGEVPVPQFPPGSPFEEFFKEFFDHQRERGQEPPARRRVTSLGSGFIVDPSGIIITNNHVIADADEIAITLSDNTRLSATIIGRDPKTDIAVLKVEAGRPLPATTWGDSEVARVGDWVLAIGNPYGLGGTVTAGIISARGRNINAGPYDDFLQTDASINRGNSGGPMFNIEGEVIGINTVIFSPTGGSVGIGFAIPSSLAKPVIDQLAKFGRTRRGWLGVRIQTVTEDLAESLGLDRAQGALVAGVTEGGPAEAAGLAAGDVILSFNGREVDEMRKLPRIVAETEAGREVEVEVWRKGRPLSLTVQIDELEESGTALAAVDPETGKQATKTIVALGMTLSAITSELRRQHEIADGVDGVVVTDVREESPARAKNIFAGDVLLEVNQEEVSSPADVVQRVREARDANRRSVLLRVRRGENFLYIVVPLAQG